MKTVKIYIVSEIAWTFLVQSGTDEVIICSVRDTNITTNFAKLSV